MKDLFIKIGLLCFFGILVYGCNDQFLNRIPLDQISEQTFWQSENDLKVYNNGLYTLAGDWRNTDILSGNFEGMYSGTMSSHSAIWRWDIMSDNMVESNSRTNYMRNVRAGIHTVRSGTDWGEAEERMSYGGWSLVRAINVGLANYDKASVTEEVRDKYAGEARLLRGWFYAQKVTHFGNVNWLDKELNIDSPELNSPRTPRDQVMDNVLADLEFAIEKLPNDWGDGGAPGRINKWVAIGIKSRICLFEGTWRKYHGLANANFWLQKSAEAAKLLIETGPYSLYKTGDPSHDYNSPFRVLSDLTGNPEIMYWKKYQMGVVINNAGNSNHEDSATKSIVDDYLCSDGLPISLSPLYKGDVNFEDLFMNRDPRLRQTVLHPADEHYYNFGNSASYTYPRVSGIIGGVTSMTGYAIIKYYNVITATNSWGSDETPAVIMRYAEILLNYAEATAELGTLTQADLDISINKLRDRVGMIHMNLNNIQVDPLYVNDGVSPLIVEIRRERRVELYAEGFRYDDLLRWKQGKKLEIPSYGMRWDAAARAKYDPAGTATVKTSIVSGVEYIDAYKGTNWGTPKFDESKHYFWPIELSVLSLAPEIGQNPNW